MPSIHDQAKDRPVIIIGNPASVFSRYLASYWHSLGFKVIIVTYRLKDKKSLPNHVKVLSASDSESRSLRTALKLIGLVLSFFEKIIIKLGNKRYHRVMSVDNEVDTYPSFVNPIIHGISIARLVRSQRPKFICGQEAFAYGFSTALCYGYPRIIIPWGGDIYRYAETSFIAFAMVKFALQKVDLVCPSSTTAGQYIVERYQIPKSKVHSISWGVYPNIFKKAGNTQREKICKQYSIDPKAIVFLNVRRFKPAWGCDTALRAFIQVAQEFPSSHFIILGGQGAESAIDSAKIELSNLGLEKKFTLFRGDISLKKCADIMSVSDIFLSLMRVRDMRSSSILQATAAGGAPILSDQKEYQAMARLGFEALFVNPEDITSVVNAMKQYATKNKFREQTLLKNHIYLATHENHQRQMMKLLKLIKGVSKSYRITI